MMIISLSLMFDHPWVCQTCHLPIPAGVWHGIPDGCYQPMAEAPHVSATPCSNCAALRERVEELEKALRILRRVIPDYRAEVNAVELADAALAVKEDADAG